MKSAEERAAQLLGTGYGQSAVIALLREHEADVRADERAKVVGEVRSAALPASVVEAMAKLAAGNHDVEELLSRAMNHAAEAGGILQKDTTIAAALTNGAAAMLQALAIFTATGKRCR